MISYESIEELVRLADESGCRISEICLEDQAKEIGLPTEEVFARMEKSFDVMLESAAWGQEPGRRSTSGLTGGDELREEFIYLLSRMNNIGYDICE